MMGLPFEFDGDLIAGIQRHGHVADVVVRWNQGQVAMRQDLGIGPVTDRDALMALAGLPHRVPIPWTEIDPVVAAVLDTLPSGLVRGAGATVERLYNPPLDITGVFKRTNRWTEAFEATTYLGRGSPRGVVMTSRRDLERVSRSAQSVGIGIALDHGGDVETVVSPSRRYIRLDDLTWLTAELVYLQVLERQSHSAQAFN